MTHSTHIAGSLLVVPTGLYKPTAEGRELHTAYVYARGRWSSPIMHLPGHSKVGRVGRRASERVGRCSVDEMGPGLLPLQRSPVQRLLTCTWLLCACCLCPLAACHCGALLPRAV